MKKTICVVCLLLSVCISASAQEKKNLVKLSIGFLNKVRIGYERTLDEKFSLGANVNAYYGAFPGLKIEPFGRYYFGSQCPDGLYTQLRFLYGSFNKNLTYYNTNDNFDFLDRNVSVSSFGGGLDLGYQWISGKNKNIVVDFSLGFQLMNAEKLTESININNKRYSPANVSFLTTGPGGIFNPHLSIGYAF